MCFLLMCLEDYKRVSNHWPENSRKFNYFFLETVFDMPRYFLLSFLLISLTFRHPAPPSQCEDLAFVNCIPHTHSLLLNGCSFPQNPQIIFVAHCISWASSLASSWQMSQGNALHINHTSTGTYRPQQGNRNHRNDFE